MNKHTKTVYIHQIQKNVKNLIFVNGGSSNDPCNLFDEMFQLKFTSKASYIAYTLEIRT